MIGRDRRSAILRKGLLIMTIQASFIPRGRNVMTVRVTSYDKYCMKGFLYHAQSDRGIEFSSAVELLLQIEALMDQTNTPQRSEETRSFPGGIGGERPSTEGRAGGEKVPSLAVFQLNVMFRQNATWQGSLLWADEGMEANFRSVLEVINLMNSALTRGKEQA